MSCRKGLQSGCLLPATVPVPLSLLISSNTGLELRFLEMVFFLALRTLLESFFQGVMSIETLRTLPAILQNSYVEGLQIRVYHAAHALDGF